jgi:DNA-binding NarL/FixJ family response regulator
MSIEVLLADDHVIVRDGIRAVVEKKGKDIKVIGEASDGRAVLEMAKKNPADVYIIDISMPVLNGIETARKLLKKDPKSKIVILSMHDDRAFVEKAIKCGVKGYILKENATEEILHAIREVYIGRFFLSPKISKYIIQDFLDMRHPREGAGKVINLTEREREILQLIAEGFTNKEIAVKLNISLDTAHVHRNNIMQKLDIHNQAGLIRYALKEGISQL